MGKYSATRIEMESPQYKALRFACYKRDGFKCLMCGGGGRLNMHHVVMWSKDESKRYLLNNVATLCEICHSKVTGNEERYEKELKLLVSQKFTKTNGKFNRPRGKYKPANPRNRYS